MVQVVTERTTVHSSESLYEHMVNGWEVVFADVENKEWRLKRPNLVNSEVEPDGG